MRWLLAIAVVLLIAAGVVAYLAIDPFADESDPTVQLGLRGSACERLAGLADRLAARDDDPNEFLLDLGQQAAGIRPGRRGVSDLARGGHNRIVGRGFKRPYDDRTRGQVRHFVGFVRAAMYGGGSSVRWISENFRGDAAESPDGRLGDRGIEFEQQVVGGRLELSDAAEWINANLCR